MTSGGATGAGATGAALAGTAGAGSATEVDVEVGGTAGVCAKASPGVATRARSSAQARGTERAERTASTAGR